jgi:hypothetical protein
MRVYIICLFTLYAISTAKAQSYYAIPAISDTLQFVKGIARTASLLTSSDSSNRKPVKILVYGQSISEQVWWKDVSAFVTNRFPLAHVSFINKSIGGFSAERLKLMVENDVVSFYPDLVLFHDYGNEADYETIIQMIRRKTTAEIAVQTDHMADQNQEWHDRHCDVWLPSICTKYGLALVDVRNSWKRYLKENKLEIKDLLVDGVHLNADGNYLMASIVKKYFAALHHPEGTDNSVKELTAGKDFRVKRNKLLIPVHGNKVDLIWNPAVGEGQRVLVNIDGQKPSASNHCYSYTRPSFDSVSFLKKIGQLLGIKLADKVKEEDWMMTVIWADSVKQQIGFSVKGSLTGEDGSGTSERTFTSTSGQLVIEPIYWFRAKAFANFQWVKPGDVLKWQVRSMCSDEVAPKASETTTIIQGVENGQHELRLNGRGLNNLRGIRVYRPPLK